MPGTQSQMGFGGMRPTTSIVNACSSGGAVVGAIAVGARTILSGALSAGVLKTLLTVNGAGEFTFLGANSFDTTSRTIRLKVTLDGVVVFDSTSGAIITVGNGNLAVGAHQVGSAFGNPAQGVSFGSSALVEIASSLTETDLVRLSYILNMH